MTPAPRAAPASMRSARLIFRVVTSYGDSHAPWYPPMRTAEFGWYPHSRSTCANRVPNSTSSTTPLAPSPPTVTSVVPGSSTSPAAVYRCGPIAASAATWA